MTTRSMQFKPEDNLTCKMRGERHYQLVDEKSITFSRGGPAR